MEHWVERLKEHGIQPSAQRVAVASFALATDRHPSADDVWQSVRKKQPTLSRATVYNTLNLFVEKGLLQELVLSEGHVVFDPNLEPHHHFVDESSGRIYDVPWDSLNVRQVKKLHGFDVENYQVVLRGRRRRER
jgi:Fe2+ or Zn2+ uptake regulation protein